MAKLKIKKKEDKKEDSVFTEDVVVKTHSIRYGDVVSQIADLSARISEMTKTKADLNAIKSEMDTLLK